MDNITPKKCLIVASGVKNHREFVDLVKERLGELLPVPEHEYKRDKAEYIGGEYRTWSESPSTHIMLAFEGVNWTSKDISTSYVLNSLIGDSTAFASGFPGRGMHSRSISNVTKKHEFVDKCYGINAHFTDSGLIGIGIEG